MTTTDQFELQLFDRDEDYYTIGTYATQADASAAIDTIPDALLRDYLGIRIINLVAEEEVIEYLISSNFKVL
jgi:hypothetical protein